MITARAHYAPQLLVRCAPLRTRDVSRVSSNGSGSRKWRTPVPSSARRIGAAQALARSNSNSDSASASDADADADSRAARPPHGLLRVEAALCCRTAIKRRALTRALLAGRSAAGEPICRLEPTRAASEPTRPSADANPKVYRCDSRPFARASSGGTERASFGARAASLHCIRRSASI